MAHIIKQLTIFFCALAFSSHAIADVVIEAENANLSGVSIESGRGASDDAYVDFQNPNGDYIEFVVNVVNAGSYMLQTTYQLGGANPRPLLLTVNGKTVDNDFILPATGSWQSWSTEQYSLPLDSGANLVRLTAVGSSGPNFDFFKIVVDEPPVPTPGRYEAEDAVLSGVSIESGRGASADEYVDFQNPSGDYIQFNISVGAAGSYVLQTTYQLGASNPRPLLLTVNGTTVDNAFALPATGSWQGWSTEAYPLDLRPGDNTIRLTAIGSSGPNFDYIEIIPDGTVPPSVPAIKVNFAISGEPPIEGYVGDFGEAYGRRGNGLTYGWLDESTLLPAGFTGYGRNRGNSPDAKKDTLMHMDHPNPDPQRGIWELEVANGIYQVTVQGGDTANEGAETNHIINAESIKLIEFQPDIGEFGSRIGTRSVAVTDGKLTLDSIGGINTKIQFVLVEPQGQLNTPLVVDSIPRDGQTDVFLDTVVSANFLHLPNVSSQGLASLDNSTITPDTVVLYLRVNGTLTSVPGTVNGTGGGDAINFTPNENLQSYSTYDFIIDGVRDLSGAEMLPTYITFVTGDQTSTTYPPFLSDVAFENRGPVADGRYTTLTIGPDGKLYGLSVGGDIHRWEIDGAGQLVNRQTLTPLSGYGARLAIGFVFAPGATADNLVAYITHSSLVFNNGPAFDGKLSRVSGPNLGSEELLITNLPRSVRDHLTNSIAFRPAEPGVLYFLQGSNSAGGAADGAWGNRPERLLSAALLRLDLNKLPADLPLDALTSQDQNVIDNADINSPALSDGSYNPYHTDAPLILYATGIRNAYDLLWHSNGKAYIPTNGTGGGSISPASVAGTRRPDGSFYYGQTVPRIEGNETQRDYLFKVDPTDPRVYFGHPNPTRGEYVLNRGPVDAGLYPDYIQPDANYAGFAYDFAFNKSPNGVIEYRSTAHNGALQGAILVTRYSGGSDIIVLLPAGPDGDISTAATDLPGLGGFDDPLDIIEDVRNGNLYISDFGSQTIILLVPD
ncbi:hypothetical protein D1AOALGA4SA_1626 [Olavius algarvensis Delta 1 endosymbiont]|nr:hypothetical protein D1AOALGA4SA_1626 [Olavius algarvensis Delta 1 endosymbiont]